MTTEPFITLDNITVRLRDRWLLAGTCWQIRRGENWVIWGPNGAGKSTLARVLNGEAATVQGVIVRHYRNDPDCCNGRPHTALISSEQIHHLYQHERWLNEMRHFAGRVDETTRAGDLLFDGAPPGRATRADGHTRAVLGLFHLTPLLERPLTALSSGEMRKLLLGRALMTDPCLLILDEPFNGLDGESRAQLVRLLVRLAGQGTQMVLITHRWSDVPGCFRHVLQLDRGRVVWQGSKDAFLVRLRQTAPTQPLAKTTAPPFRHAACPPPGPPLIHMRDVTVRFGRQTALDRISWTVHAGENWALIGPNGAGKSTLLDLITGDQLQAYANDISLFGRPRGSGETVWEIKKNIGRVGDVLQARYQRDMNGFDVICSGFFDSVGLYRHCSDEQRRTAGQWVHFLQMQDLCGQPMGRLSYGQQRLLLIARAVVKSPRLLILDEPCNGLDHHHRRRLLDLLDSIAAGGTTHLLYVSHRPDETPACITHRLYLDGGRIVSEYPPSPEAGER